MCGIWLSVLPKASDKDLPEDIPLLLRNRGPNLMLAYRCDLGEFSLLAMSSVLHMRGDELSPQPFVGKRFVFQWNGEIFGGQTVIIIPLSPFHKISGSLQ